MPHTIPLLAWDAVASDAVFALRKVAERRLLDQVEAGGIESFLDGFVRDRAGESLAHVFTLLSLVLSREPLQIAFRSLHTDDQQLRGTALEYLEGVLPAPIRQRLWPFLERGPVTRPVRPRDEVISDLLRSNHSIALALSPRTSPTCWRPIDRLSISPHHAAPSHLAPSHLARP